MTTSESEALKEQGIQAERNYTIREPEVEYVVPLVVLCKNGRVELTDAQIRQKQLDPTKFVREIADLVYAAGGQR